MQASATSDFPISEMINTYRFYSTTVTYARILSIRYLFLYYVPTKSQSDIAHANTPPYQILQ
jgi:hypothetical protein